MKLAEIKQDLFLVPKEFRDVFGGKAVVSRAELQKIFCPLVRARRRGYYSDDASLFVTIEPRQVIEGVPREFVRFLSD